MEVVAWVPSPIGLRSRSVLVPCDLASPSRWRALGLARSRHQSLTWDGQCGSGLTLALPLPLRLAFL